MTSSQCQKSERSRLRGYVSRSFPTPNASCATVTDALTQFLPLHYRHRALPKVTTTRDVDNDADFEPLPEGIHEVSLCAGALAMNHPLHLSVKGDDTTPSWSSLLAAMRRYDEATLRRWKEEMTLVLIFVSTSQFVFTFAASLINI